MEIKIEQSINQTINLVMYDLVRLGISKDSVNETQKYKYRGIDALYNTVSAIFVKHGLIIFSEVLEYQHEIIVTEKFDNYTKQMKKTATDYVRQKIQFNIEHIHNEQSKRLIRWGEAFDTSDKATNKSSTSAYKYALFELFNIPLAGQEIEDSDKITLERAVDNDTSEVSIPTATKKINLKYSVEQMKIKDLWNVKRHAILKALEKHPDKLEQIESICEKAITPSGLDIAKLFEYLKGL